MRGDASISNHERVEQAVTCVKPVKAIIGSKWTHMSVRGAEETLI